MKTIALTGNPMAQDAAALQLQALINGRNLGIRVRVGVTELEEAHGIHDAGGEIWHCGVDAPRASLAGAIDRELPACTFEDLSHQVVACLKQFEGKTRVAA